VNTKKHTLYLTIFLFVSLVFLTLNVHATSNTSFYWSPNVKFKLTAYNTVIGFDDYVLFDSFTWQYPVSNQITFNNIQKDGVAVSSWTVTVENANLTVHKFFADNKLTFTLTASTGTTSTMQFSCAGKGEPFMIQGVSEWSYDEATDTVTVKAYHESPVYVAVEWKNENYEPPEPDYSKWLFNPFTILQYFFSGDFLGAFQALYVNVFHSIDLFYAMLLLLFTMPIYIRTKSLTFISILWILIGSIVITVVPSVAGMAVLFLGLGIGGLLFKTFMMLKARRGG